MTSGLSDGVLELIEHLSTTPRLSKATAAQLYRAACSKAVSGILAGQTCGQASGGLALLNQPEQAFRAELKAIDGDLAKQVAIVNETLDGWFERGEQPAPYYAWRIAVLLGKQKRREEERAFLGAWCAHFGTIVGGRYEKLAERARKLGVFA